MEIFVAEEVFYYFFPFRHGVVEFFVLKTYRLLIPTLTIFYFFLNFMNGRDIGTFVQHLKRCESIGDKLLSAR